MFTAAEAKEKSLERLRIIAQEFIINNTGMPIQEAINMAKEQAHKDATAILAEAETMIGYMGDSDWLNRSEALESKRDNVQDIYDALWEEKDLSVEQVQTLYNDIIPDLIKNNPQLSVQDLYKTFTEGGPLALSYINEYLEDFNKYAELNALDTLGHDQEKLEDSLSDLFNTGFKWEGFEIQYDEDGIVDIENTLAQLPQQAIEEYMSGGEYDWEDEFNTLTNDIATYYKNMAQYDASKTELEKEEKLTPEEIRRANLEAQIAKLSENSLTHRIELIKLELELNKELSRELSKQLQSEKERWNKALEGFDLSKVEDRDANGIIDIDDILKIENGQVEIIESVYEGLDEQLKIHITMALHIIDHPLLLHKESVSICFSFHHRPSHKIVKRDFKSIGNVFCCFVPNFNYVTATFIITDKTATVIACNVINLLFSVCKYFLLCRRNNSIDNGNCNCTHKRFGRKSPTAKRTECNAYSKPFGNVMERNRKYQKDNSV